MVRDAYAFWKTRRINGYTKYNNPIPEYDTYLRIF
jgi:hypothetical protein